MDELCETEVKIPGGRRLDSATNKTATEIEQNFHNIPKVNLQNILLAIPYDLVI